jgi:hypothetical protein
MKKLLHMAAMSVVAAEGELADYRASVATTEK